MFRASFDSSNMIEEQFFKEIGRHCKAMVKAYRIYEPWLTGSEYKKLVCEAKCAKTHDLDNMKLSQNNPNRYRPLHLERSRSSNRKWLHWMNQEGLEKDPLDEWIIVQGKT